MNLSLNECILFETIKSAYSSGLSKHVYKCVFSKLIISSLASSAIAASIEDLI